MFPGPGGQLLDPPAQGQKVHPGWRPQAAAPHHSLSQVRALRLRACPCPPHTTPVGSLEVQPGSPRPRRLPRTRCPGPVRLQLLPRTAAPARLPVCRSDCDLGVGGRVAFVLLAREPGRVLRPCCAPPTGQASARVHAALRPRRPLPRAAPTASGLRRRTRGPLVEDTGRDSANAAPPAVGTQRFLVRWAGSASAGRGRRQRPAPRPAHHSPRSPAGLAGLRPRRPQSGPLRPCPPCLSSPLGCSGAPSVWPPVAARLGGIPVTVRSLAVARSALPGSRACSSLYPLIFPTGSRVPEAWARPGPGSPQTDRPLASWLHSPCPGGDPRGRVPEGAGSRSRGAWCRSGSRRETGVRRGPRE